MPKLQELDLLLVDCQTTGATPRQGSVIELGWARTGLDDPDSPSMSPPHARLVSPDEESLPERVVDITGITDDMLEEADAPETVWRAFGDALRSADRLIAHYAQFERRFVVEALRRHADLDAIPDFICTHRIAERLYPGLPRRGLRAFAGFLGHPVAETNRAEPHVRATAAIWDRLLDELRHRADVTSLAELEQLLDDPPPETGDTTYAVDRDDRLSLPDRPGVYRLLGPEGDTLYVGKATSLKNRVNQYFQTKRGLSENKLELVAQVHDIDARPEATPLEAALAETDAIKSDAPPYNSALREDDRDVCRQPIDELRDPPGLEDVESIPLRDRRDLETFVELADALAATDRLAAHLPLDDREALADTVETFARQHELDDPPGLDALFALGAELWPPPDRDEEEEPTPLEHLESLVRRGAAALRRGLWLDRLPGAALVWSPDTWDDTAERYRFAGFDGTALAATETLGNRRTAAAALEAWGGERIGVDSIAEFDRLRVLTTELKRLADRADRRRSIVVELPNGPRLDRRTLAACLAWI